MAWRMTAPVVPKFAGWAQGPNMVVPDIALPYKARAFPKTCVVCSGRFEDRYGIALAVQHADLIPGLVGFRLFQAMPKKVRFKAILAGLRGKGKP